MCKSVEVGAKRLKKDLIDHGFVDSGFAEAGWRLYVYDNLETLPKSYRASILILVIHILTLILDKNRSLCERSENRSGDKVARREKDELSLRIHVQLRTGTPRGIPV